MKTQKPLNLSQFRKSQPIPANPTPSICSSLQIETENINWVLFANAFSKEYGINTDTLLFYAFQEYENTGELVNTISKNFIDIKMGNADSAIWVSIGDLEEQIRKERNSTTAPPPAHQNLKEEPSSTKSAYTSHSTFWSRKVVRVISPTRVFLKTHSWS